MTETTFHIRYTAPGLDRDLEPFRPHCRVIDYDNGTNCYEIAVQDDHAKAFKKAFKNELKSPTGGHYKDDAVLEALRGRTL